MYKHYNKNMTNKYEITNQGDDEPTNQYKATNRRQRTNPHNETNASQQIRTKQQARPDKKDSIPTVTIQTTIINISLL